MRTKLFLSACLLVLAGACSPAGKAPELVKAPEAAKAGDNADVPPKADPASPVILPLRTGYYVDSDTTCAEASNATLQLLGRHTINTSHVACPFDAVVQRAVSTFAVTMTCSDDGAAFGHETNVETRTDVFDISSDTEFSVTYAGGGSTTNRFCAQAALPEPWRTNDIAEFIK